jgi:hypothetical protein
MLVVNLARNQNYQELWTNAVDTIRQGHDQLRENYLNIKPSDFACFPAVIDNDKIVCFSALQLSPDRWGEHIGRVSTRMWLHPDYRHMGKFTGGTKFLNTTYCLPLQLAEARRLDLDCVFISREENLKGFQEYLKLIKINCDLNFELEENKFNVCGSLDCVPEGCKQWVAKLNLTDVGSSIWDSFKSKYQL